MFVGFRGKGWFGGAWESTAATPEQAADGMLGKHGLEFIEGEEILKKIVITDFLNFAINNLNDLVITTKSAAAKLKISSATFIKQAKLLKIKCKQVERKIGNGKYVYPYLWSARELEEYTLESWKAKVELIRKEQLIKEIIE